MPREKSKQHMSSQYVASKAEEHGFLVEERKHAHGRTWTIYDEKGNNLTLPDRPLYPAEQQVSNSWFKKFLGIVLLGLLIWGLIALL